MRPLNSIIPHTATAIVIVALSVSVPTQCYAVDWFVDASVTTSGDGSGWGDTIAFKYLSDAIAAASSQGGDVIKVKGATGAGLTYVTDRSVADPDGSCTPGPCNPTIAFGIDKQLVIEGQYTGADLTTHNPAYRTILSGAIAATENSYSVVRFVGTLSSQTVLDGLEVRDGVADGGLVNPEYGRGGGIFVGGSAPDIRACWIIGNHAVPKLPPIGTGGEGPQDGLGGGVFAGNGATLTLRACTIADNIGQYGGGLCRRAGVTMASPTSHTNIIACDFHANSALAPVDDGARGGGCLIDRWGGDVNVVASAFVGNVAEGDQRTAVAAPAAES